MHRRGWPRMAARAPSAPAGPSTETPPTARCPPIEEMTPADFAFFAVPVGMGKHKEYRVLDGCTRGLPEGWVFEHQEFNTFAERPTRVPPRARRRAAQSAEWVAKYFCDPAKRRLVADEAALPAGATGKAYRIEDNGGMPFVSYVRPDAVSVFRVPEDGYVRDDDWSRKFKRDRLFYTEEVGTFASAKTFIGIDANQGKHGNSILVHLSGSRYVYIGDEIYAFDASDEVVEYYSYMGNSSVPYPVALTKLTAIFMNDKVEVKRADLAPHVPKKAGAEDWGDAYDAFYEIGENLHNELANLEILAERKI